MIKILTLEEAKRVWDSTILTLENPTYFQSVDYAKAYKGNSEVEFIYSKEEGKSIYGFVKIGENKVKMPFGPIVSSNVTPEDLIEYIVEISKHYNKNVVFAASNGLIPVVDQNYPDLEKIWLFVTPVIDTTLPIETIVKNSTENRRRIIKKGLANIPSDRIHEGIEYLEDFYKLYIKRMAETGGEVDFTTDTLAKYLKEPTSHLVVCLDGSKVIAGHMVFSFGKTMITRYNCFDSDYAKISPAARIEYELIKRACENPLIENYDMSGLAVGDDVSKKLMSINRYKESYNPTKVFKYQWYKYKK